MVDSYKKMGQNDHIESRPTFWDKGVRYVGHYYDVDIGEPCSLRVCEELFVGEDTKYGYFKAWSWDSKEVILHEYKQPRSFKTGRFQKKVEIVGAGHHR